MTNGLKLRDVIESDLPILFEQQREPEANEMAAFAARDKDAFMAHWTKILRDENVTVRAILVAEHVVGNIGCWERDNKRLVGYWIGKAYWGKGFATMALAKFLSEVKVRPLYAHVAKANIASIRVLEKCGFMICREATEHCVAPSDGVEEVVMKLD